jgi:hypothetical protein
MEELKTAQPSASLVERVARALRDSARGFADPVDLYVEKEARRRAEAANPDADTYATAQDWGLESWMILARAAIEAMREPTEEMRSAGDDLIQRRDGTAAIYQAMIDAALSQVSEANGPK